jgi:hypothetical protein
MQYKLFTDEDGGFVDLDGNPCNIMECEKAVTPQGVNVGWKRFDSLEEAMDFWEVYIPDETIS